MIAENTANMAGGRSPSGRWIESVERFEDKEPEKTAEDVISDIRMKIKNL